MGNATNTNGNINQMEILWREYCWVKIVIAIHWTLSIPYRMFQSIARVLKAAWHRAIEFLVAVVPFFLYPCCWLLRQQLSTSFKTTENSLSLACYCKTITLKAPMTTGNNSVDFSDNLTDFISTESVNTLHESGNKSIKWIGFPALVITFLNFIFPIFIVWLKYFVVSSQLFRPSANPFL